ncbi:hypothetical protein WA026_021332 [Henosepilachna vigintioctopunctata]|uniref:Uncharacterized protein n=1 Tax=Henosepilachna vigintioctopunctata TaxID=420089 RepID=A0AAW1UC86_9CUCU
MENEDLYENERNDEKRYNTPRTIWLQIGPSTEQQLLRMIERAAKEIEMKHSIDIFTTESYSRRVSTAIRELREEETESKVANPTAEKEVLVIIKRLKRRKARGPDNTTHAMIKNLPSRGREEVAKIINGIIPTNLFPKSTPCEKQIRREDYIKEAMGRNIKFENISGRKIWIRKQIFCNSTDTQDGIRDDTLEVDVLFAAPLIIEFFKRLLPQIKSEIRYICFPLSVLRKFIK